jgi:preprotein translocase subunit SecE
LIKASSIIGNAADSKSEDCGFNSCLACQNHLGEATVLMAAIQFRRAMGRLLRKKTVSKKKKQKQENGEPEGTVNEAESKIVSLTDFSKNKQKQAPSPKKTLSEVIPTPEFWTKSVQFFREVRIELKKVTWPSRPQTIGSTAVVIILVVIISFFLGLVDMGLSGLVQLILH